MQRWNINYLKKLYTKYSSIAAKTSNPTLSLEYESTANSILDIIDRYNEMTNKGRRNFDTLEFPYYKEIVSSDFSIISKYGYYCPFVRLLSEYWEKLSLSPNTDLPIINTDANKIITVSRSFYDTLESPFADEFQIMSTTFKDTIHMKKLTGSTITAGQTYHVYGTDISFFELGYNNTLQDYVSAIHEFGHGVSCRFNHDAMWDFGKYCLIEVDSLFFELLGTDYLGEKLNRPKDAFDINIHVLKDYIYSAMLIKTKLDMYSTFDRIDLNNKRFTKQYLQQEVGLNKAGIKDVMTSYIRDYMHYVISYLTAVELYLIYQNNPNKALELLFNIINIRKNNSKDYLEYIRTLGIEPGKNFDSYIGILFEKAKDLKDDKSLRYKN